MIRALMTQPLVGDSALTTEVMDLEIRPKGWGAVF